MPYRAIIAFGLAGYAGITAMQDKPVMGVVYKFISRDAEQVQFDVNRIFAGGHACTV